MPEIDALLYPHKLTAAGVHGAYIRYLDGPLEEHSLDQDVKASVWQAIQELKETYPKLIIEDKKVAYTLHYRNAPELESRILTLVTNISQNYPEVFKVQQGKCVCELLPININKGSALCKIMDTPLFRHKIPIYFGDDVTDEAAFAYVNQKGGISIKVGEGVTQAHFRVANVSAVIAWLKEVALNQHIANGEVSPVYDR